MHVCHIFKSYQGGGALGTGAGACPHAVRGICAKPCGRWGGGLCAIAACVQCGPGAVGARPLVGQRGGGALFAGGRAAFCDGATFTTGRGFDGDGRRPAQRRFGGGGGRGLGCACAAGFHRDAAACAAGRGDGGGLLADPARGGPRFKCGAQPVAGGITAIGIARPRPTSTGRCALAGGFVPITFHRPQCMGGAL
jgi:hypothetical protein